MRTLRDEITAAVVPAVAVIAVGFGAVFLASCGSDDSASTDSVESGYTNAEVVVPAGVKVFDVDGGANKLDGNWPKVATWCDGTTRYTVTNGLGGGSGAYTGAAVDVTPNGCKEEGS